MSDVSLAVADDVVALIGANGAGKTTLVHLISGIYHPRKGRISWQGNDISRSPPHKIVRLGIAQVPEGRQLFPNHSVRVNLSLGGYGKRRTRREEQQNLEEVYELLPRLRERQNQSAGTLSGGEQQMLSVGRALMAQPRLLILDEPSMGLAPTIVEDIFSTLRQLRQKGIGILLVEQNARLALELADVGYVLETGRVVMHGEADVLAADQRVQRAYLGAKVEADGGGAAAVTTSGPRSP